MIHTACHYPFAPSAKRQTTSTKANLTLQFPQTPKNKKASPCGASLLLSHALLVRGVGFGAFTYLMIYFSYTLDYDEVSNSQSLSSNNTHSK